MIHVPEAMPSTQTNSYKFLVKVLGKENVSAIENGTLSVDKAQELLKQTLDALHTKVKAATEETYPELEKEFLGEGMIPFDVKDIKQVREFVDYLYKGFYDTISTLRSLIGSTDEEPTDTGKDEEETSPHKAFKKKTLQGMEGKSVKEVLRHVREGLKNQEKIVEHFNKNVNQAYRTLIDDILKLNPLFVDYMNEQEASEKKVMYHSLEQRYNAVISDFKHTIASGMGNKIPFLFSFYRASLENPDHAVEVLENSPIMMLVEEEKVVEELEKMKTNTLHSIQELNERDTKDMGPEDLGDLEEEKKALEERVKSFQEDMEKIANGSLPFYQSKFYPLIKRTAFKHTLLGDLKGLKDSIHISPVDISESIKDRDIFKLVKNILTNNPTNASMESVLSMGPRAKEPLMGLWRKSKVVLDALSKTIQKSVKEVEEHMDYSAPIDTYFARKPSGNVRIQSAFRKGTPLETSDYTIAAENTVKQDIKAAFHSAFPLKDMVNTEALSDSLGVGTAPAQGQVVSDVRKALFQSHEVLGSISLATYSKIEDDFEKYSRVVAVIKNDIMSDINFIRAFRSNLKNSLGVLANANVPATKELEQKLSVYNNGALTEEAREQAKLALPELQKKEKISRIILTRLMDAIVDSIDSSLVLTKDKPFEVKEGTLLDELKKVSSKLGGNTPLPPIFSELDAKGLVLNKSNSLFLSHTINEGYKLLETLRSKVADIYANVTKMQSLTQELIKDIPHSFANFHSLERTIDIALRTPDFKKQMVGKTASLSGVLDSLERMVSSFSSSEDLLSKLLEHPVYKLIGRFSKEKNEVAQLEGEDLVKDEGLFSYIQTHLPDNSENLEDYLSKYRTFLNEVKVLSSGSKKKDADGNPMLDSEGKPVYNPSKLVEVVNSLPEEIAKMVEKAYTTGKDYNPKSKTASFSLIRKAASLIHNGNLMAAANLLRKVAKGGGEESKGYVKGEVDTTSKSPEGGSKDLPEIVLINVIKGITPSYQKKIRDIQDSLEEISDETKNSNDGFVPLEKLPSLEKNIKSLRDLLLSAARSSENKNFLDSIQHSVAKYLDQAIGYLVEIAQVEESLSATKVTGEDTDVSIGSSEEYRIERQNRAAEDAERLLSCAGALKLANEVYNSTLARDIDPSYNLSSAMKDLRDYQKIQDLHKSGLFREGERDLDSTSLKAIIQDITLGLSSQGIAKDVLSKIYDFRDNISVSGKVINSLGHAIPSLKDSLDNFYKEKGVGVTVGDLKKFISDPAQGLSPKDILAFERDLNAAVNDEHVPKSLVAEIAKGYKDKEKDQSAYVKFVEDHLKSLRAAGKEIASSFVDFAPTSKKVMKDLESLVPYEDRNLPTYEGMHRSFHHAFTEAVERNARRHLHSMLKEDALKGTPSLSDKEKEEVTTLLKGNLTLGSVFRRYLHEETSKKGIHESETAKLLSNILEKWPDKAVANLFKSYLHLQEGREASDLPASNIVRKALLAYADGGEGETLKKVLETEISNNSSSISDEASEKVMALLSDKHLENEEKLKSLDHEIGSLAPEVAAKNKESLDKKVKEAGDLLDREFPNYSDRSDADKALRTIAERSILNRKSSSKDAITRHHESLDEAITNNMSNDTGMFPLEAIKQKMLEIASDLPTPQYRGVSYDLSPKNAGSKSHRGDSLHGVLTAKTIRKTSEIPVHGVTERLKHNEKVTDEDTSTRIEHEAVRRKNISNTQDILGKATREYLESLEGNSRKKEKALEDKKSLSQSSLSEEEKADQEQQLNKAISDATSESEIAHNKLMDSLEEANKSVVRNRKPSSAHRASSLRSYASILTKELMDKKKQRATWKKDISSSKDPSEKKRLQDLVDALSSDIQSRSSKLEDFYGNPREHIKGNPEAIQREATEHFKKESAKDMEEAKAIARYHKEKVTNPEEAKKILASHGIDEEDADLNAAMQKALDSYHKAAELDHTYDIPSTGSSRQFVGAEGEMYKAQMGRASTGYSPTLGRTPELVMSTSSGGKYYIPEAKALLERWVDRLKNSGATSFIGEEGELAKFLEEEKESFIGRIKRDYRDNVLEGGTFNGITHKGSIQKLQEEIDYWEQLIKNLDIQDKEERSSFHALMDELAQVVQSNEAMSKKVNSKVQDYYNAVDEMAQKHKEEQEAKGGSPFSAYAMPDLSDTIDLYNLPSKDYMKVLKDLKGKLLQVQKGVKVSFSGLEKALLGPETLDNLESDYSHVKDVLEDLKPSLRDYDQEGKELLEKLEKLQNAPRMKGGHLDLSGIKFTDDDYHLMGMGLARKVKATIQGTTEHYLGNMEGILDSRVDAFKKKYQTHAPRKLSVLKKESTLNLVTEYTHEYDMLTEEHEDALKTLAEAHKNGEISDSKYHTMVTEENASYDKSAKEIKDALDKRTSKKSPLRKVMDPLKKFKKLDKSSLSDLENLFDTLDNMHTLPGTQVSLEVKGKIGDIQKDVKKLIAIKEAKPSSPGEQDKASKDSVELSEKIAKGLKGLHEYSNVYLDPHRGVQGTDKSRITSLQRDVAQLVSLRDSLARGAFESSPTDKQKATKEMKELEEAIKGNLEKMQTDPNPLLQAIAEETKYNTFTSSIVANTSALDTIIENQDDLEDALSNNDPRVGKALLSLAKVHMSKYNGVRLTFRKDVQDFLTRKGKEIGKLTQKLNSKEYSKETLRDFGELIVDYKNFYNVYLHDYMTPSTVRVFEDADYAYAKSPSLNADTAIEHVGRVWTSDMSLNTLHNLVAMLENSRYNDEEKGKIEEAAKAAFSKLVDKLEEAADALKDGKSSYEDLVQNGYVSESRDLMNDGDYEGIRSEASLKKDVSRLKKVLSLFSRARKDSVNREVISLSEKLSLFLNANDESYDPKEYALISTEVKTFLESPAAKEMSEKLKEEIQEVVDKLSKATKKNLDHINQLAKEVGDSFVALNKKWPLFATIQGANQVTDEIEGLLSKIDILSSLLMQMPDASSVEVPNEVITLIKDQKSIPAGDKEEVNSPLQMLRVMRKALVGGYVAEAPVKKKRTVEENTSKTARDAGDTMGWANDKQSGYIGNTQRAFPGAPTNALSEGKESGPSIKHPDIQARKSVVRSLFDAYNDYVKNYGKGKSIKESDHHQRSRDPFARMGGSTKMISSMRDSHQNVLDAIKHFRSNTKVNAGHSMDFADKAAQYHAALNHEKEVDSLMDTPEAENLKLMDKHTSFLTSIKSSWNKLVEKEKKAKDTLQGLYDKAIKEGASSDVIKHHGDRLNRAKENLDIADNLNTHGADYQGSDTHNLLKNLFQDSMKMDLEMNKAITLLGKAGTGYEGGDRISTEQAMQHLMEAENQMANKSAQRRNIKDNARDKVDSLYDRLRMEKEFLKQAKANNGDGLSNDMTRHWVYIYTTSLMHWLMVTWRKNEDAFSIMYNAKPEDYFDFLETHQKSLGMFNNPKISVSIQFTQDLLKSKFLERNRYRTPAQKEMVKRLLDDRRKLFLYKYSLTHLENFLNGLSDFISQEKVPFEGDLRSEQTKTLEVLHKYETEGAKAASNLVHDHEKLMELEKSEGTGHSPTPSVPPTQGPDKAKTAGWSPKKGSLVDKVLGLVYK